MKRKYLDDAGITDRWDTWDLGSEERVKKCKKKAKETGVDPREVWNLDSAFYCWLYERLVAYLPNCKTIVQEKIFDFQGNKYTQEEMVCMMIERLDLILKENNMYKPEYMEAEDEVLQLFSETIRSLWT